MRKILKALAAAALTVLLLSSTALATMYQGRKEIATTDTAVAIYGSSQVVEWVSLYAPNKNIGPVYVGSSTVSYDGTTTDGRPLLPGGTVVLGSCNLNNVYIDGLDNDAVYFTASDESGVDLGSITTLLGTWTSTGEMASDAAVKASAGVLYGIIIETDGTNDVLVQLFDDPDSSDGTELTPIITVAGGDNYGGVVGLNVAFLLGCWAEMSGSGVETVVVYYR